MLICVIRAKLAVALKLPISCQNNRKRLYYEIFRGGQLWRDLHAGMCLDTQKWLDLRKKPVCDEKISQEHHFWKQTTIAFFLYTNILYRAYIVA